MPSLSKSSRAYGFPIFDWLCRADPIWDHFFLFPLIVSPVINTVHAKTANLQCPRVSRVRAGVGEGQGWDEAKDRNGYLSHVHCAYVTTMASKFAKLRKGLTKLHSFSMFIATYVHHNFRQLGLGKCSNMLHSQNLLWCCHGIWVYECCGIRSIL